MSSPQVVRAMQRAVGLHQAGKFSEAERIYRDVLKQEPRNADALQLLGLLAHQAQKHDVAVELIRKAILIRPQAEFYVNLSQAYRALGRLQDCLDACRRAVQLAPNLPEAWNNLGSALKDVGQAEEAIKSIQRAIQLRPSYAAAFNNLGNVLAQLGKGAEAEAALRRSIQADPKYVEAISNLAHLLTRMGRLDEAERLCRHALQLRPSFVPAYANLGTALQLQGKLDEGNDVYRQGIALAPNDAHLHENLLTGMNYSTRWSPQQTLEAHVAWAKRFADAGGAIAPHVIDPNPVRRLRIGYVSPDFKRHSVAYFLQPILEQHDRQGFEIFAYSNTDRTDDVTEQLRRLCDHWRDVTTLSDDAAAELVRRDQIDVLVDLAGHTNDNRLGLFGRKPAPVQMTYLGYPNTTGLSTIDYRLTDEVCDPPGATDAHHSEKLLRLPAPFLCYRPPDEAHVPPVTDPPMLRNGYVTFGSFNKAAKAGPETIALWAKVLTALSASRLLMKSRGLGDAGSRGRLLDGFAAHGVAPERIELLDAKMSLRDHLSTYGRIDVALDTFPYHGTTTTCEATLMGVPVISRIGSTHVSRVGLTLLRALDRPDFSAASDDAYVEVAQSLTSDASRLRADRQTLRGRLGASPLCDPNRLTRAIERSLAEAFATWSSAQR